jgi:hypothetical protein
MKNHKLIPIIVISLFIAGCTNAGKNQAIKTTKDSKGTSSSIHKYRREKYHFYRCEVCR